MPTTLPNGLVIYNACPHELVFWWEESQEEIVVARDEVINSMPLTTTVVKKRLYHLTKIEYTFLNEGKRIIKEVRQQYPTALIVGSIIAAMGYPGQVYATVPFQRKDRLGVRPEKRLLRPDRFTTF